MQWLALVTICALSAYVLLCAVLYAMQGRLLYFPTPAADPPGAEAIRVRSGDLSLKIWRIRSGERGAVLYFGGNAEDVAAKIAEYTDIFPDQTVYLVHYRGYGGNDGTPSERMLIADALAVFDQIRPQHTHIVVMGRSLGSGVATAVAACRPVERLILVTPYDSIARVAADHYGWAPVRWLIRDRFDSVSRMKQVSAPVLVLIAARDDVVFRARSDSLASAIPAGLGQVHVFPQATHNDINLQPGYRERIRVFIDG